jgi:CRISPR/Cas system-associated protein Cas10 (large subunit of type III CRISPR-Cas system)
LKGRIYLELEEMFQKRLPARQFKNYQCDLDHTARAKTDEEEDNKGSAVYVEAVN